MDAEKIIEQINKLSSEERDKVYLYVGSKIKRKEYLLKVLDKIKGRGKGLWGDDAQSYINREREDDRL